MDGRVMFILTQETKHEVSFGDTLVYECFVGMLVYDPEHPEGTCNRMTLDRMMEKFSLVLVHPRKR
jgi:hypothetical protein